MFSCNYSELTSMLNLINFIPTFFWKTLVFDSLDYTGIIFVKKFPFCLSETLNGLKTLFSNKNIQNDPSTHIIPVIFLINMTL